MSEKTNNDSSEAKPFNLGKEIFEWVYTIAIAVVIALLIKGFIFDVVRVDGSSMYPTLVDNDRLIVTKLGYKPQQGDIVILDSEYKNQQAYYDKIKEENGGDLSLFQKLAAKAQMPDNLKTRYYVKRVIALPGQTLDLKDGKVYVDGQLLDEPYYDGVTTSIDSSVTYPITVGEDMVFVMGDNRTRSKDSRSSELGQVPLEALLGRSQVRIWPLNDIGLTR